MDDFNHQWNCSDETLKEELGAMYKHELEAAAMMKEEARRVEEAEARLKEVESRTPTRPTETAVPEASTSRSNFVTENTTSPVVAKAIAPSTAVNTGLGGQFAPLISAVNQIAYAVEELSLIHI